ncbi:MAG TPA: hypothetical protein VGM19_11065 [Armatimonadota bacterium]|jgi:uncharacterized integral membrane protein
MVKTVLLVLAVLLLIAYGGLFLSWNPTPVPVVGFQWGQGWAEDVPTGVLVLGGVLLGAILMACFTLGGWASERSRRRAAEALVVRAKQKLSDATGIIKRQREKLEEPAPAAEKPADQPTATAPPESDEPLAVELQDDEEDDETI